MNVIDRSFAAQADRIAKAEAARRKRRLKATLAATALGVALIAYYVWATTLCGDCGAPLPLPPA